MDQCKVCDHSLELIMSFGDMPIANGFIPQVSSKEFFYELRLEFCPRCYMVQIGQTVKPQDMFNENYHFISSTSSVMSAHFRKVAEEMIAGLSDEELAFVVEIGCNDGIMLKHFAAKGIKHLGIEPSGNVAALARENGVFVFEKFFNRVIAQEILEQYGPADFIYGANVIGHIEDLNSVLEGIGLLLKPAGTLIIENPYLAEIIKKTSFDQVYDEHVYFFSGLSISEAAKKFSLQLVDMVSVDVHGGSMRYYLKKGDTNAVSDRVKEYIAEERSFDLHRIEGYRGFKDNVNKICSDLKSTLLKIKRQGSQIVGYGATAKSSTLLNYARIGPEMIDYISDTTPTKINKYTPGTHIPIRSYETFTADDPSYAVLFAWNHKREIFAKEKAYRDRGGKFITYFPEITIE
ncbi:methyltransferase domain-containing protein [Candidatus Omnitrophota bacterium]